MFQQFQNLLTDLKTGARKSAEASKAAYNAPNREYYPSVLKMRGLYQDELNKLGVSLKETPVQAVGAAGARLLTDLSPKYRDFIICPSFCKDLSVVKYRKCRNVPLFNDFFFICPSF